MFGHKVYAHMCVIDKHVCDQNFIKFLFYCICVAKEKINKIYIEIKFYIDLQQLYIHRTCKKKNANDKR